METITLYNGVVMPLVGLGTFKIDDAAAGEANIIDAIHCGYRLLDTAQAYGNEEIVGKAVKRSGVDRHELFLTTKIWYRSFESPDCEKSVEASLRKLGTDYLDLLLLHWPYGNIYNAWRTLEKLYRAGTVRAIGVSNFMESQLMDLLEFNDVAPAVDQVETHLRCQYPSLHALLRERGIAHQAYSPFGRFKDPTMFTAPAITAISEKYGKTPQQIALRFFTQDGISVVPKSMRRERLLANKDLFDISLTDEEMTALRQMNSDLYLIGNSQDGAFTKAFFAR